MGQSQVKSASRVLYQREWNRFKANTGQHESILEKAEAIASHERVYPYCSKNHCSLPIRVLSNFAYLSNQSNQGIANFALTGVLKMLGTNEEKLCRPLRKLTRGGTVSLVFILPCISLHGVAYTIICGELHGTRVIERSEMMWGGYKTRPKHECSSDISPISGGNSFVKKNKILIDTRARLDDIQFLDW
ncbi:hypothetical protein EDB82DRAFT_485507 [Fusarium venenatum]|uniref:uncharacterized protein n=1 Tax=Fusarium venenatum TaxID=56646 RepID=UPI001DF7496C|nr:hypothetical protein EDB82DRAFT_485507 [Fusarium venenatum]